MGKYQRFDEVPVWQEAARLYQRVLDVVEEPNVPLSATFRNQLERATLCVSGSVAEGFDWVSTSELLSLLGTARGAAIEVQSMAAVVAERPKVARLREPLQQIRASAEACARQLGAWRHAIENPGQGKRQSQEGQAPGPAPGPSASGKSQGFKPNPSAPSSRVGV
jgi:four helix bundle protein